MNRLDHPFSQEKSIGYIYKITSPSGKSYIGQTNDFDRRMCEHSLGRGRTRLCSSIKKHRWQNHVVSILWEGECTSEQLNTLEVEFIKLYDTYYNGLNLTEGGGGKRGFTPSEETRAKIREARSHQVMKPISDETRAKMSAANKGRPSPNKGKPAHNKGKKQSAETITKRLISKEGYTHSEEARAKMSIAKKGKPSSKRGTTLSEERKAAMRETWKLRKEGKFLNKS